MDVEKLIEQLNEYFEGKELKRGVALDAATSLSTFQDENEKLRVELEQKSKLIAQQAAELERRDTLLKEPAADVAEVRHGRWEFLGPNRLIKSCMCGTCSVCHVRSVYIVNTAICPNCGARMDKEGEHETN